MSQFHANNTKAISDSVRKTYGIVMVDNGATVPYTDVVIDCSGSMAADMGGMNRLIFSVNLLKVLHGLGHVKDDTVVHGFSQIYRGSVPLWMIINSFNAVDNDIVKSLFDPYGGTDFRKGIKHVNNLGSTLAILDMWSEGDLKPSYMTPYDFIFYGVP